MRKDILFTNKPERIIKHYNVLTGLSDHNTIFFSRKLTKQCFLNSVKTTAYHDIVPKNQQQNLRMRLIGVKSS